MNLQKTPKDKKAAMLVRARCDEFLQAVVAHLELPVPDYIRTDRLRLGHRQSLKAKKSKDLEPISVQVFVESVHGRDCPLPLVDRVEISFPVSGIFVVEFRARDFGRSNTDCCSTRKKQKKMG